MFRDECFAPLARDCFMHVSFLCSFFAASAKGGCACNLHSVQARSNRRLPHDHCVGEALRRACLALGFHPEHESLSGAARVSLSCCCFSSCFFPPQKLRGQMGPVPLTVSTMSQLAIAAPRRVSKYSWKHLQVIMKVQSPFSTCTQVYTNIMIAQGK